MKNVDSLSERIARFRGLYDQSVRENKMYLGGMSELARLLTDCQAEIVRLTDRVQLFEDAKYPEEIARLEALFRVANDHHCSLESQLTTSKTQMERSERLLRRLQQVPLEAYVLAEIAGYFREKERP